MNYYIQNQQFSSFCIGVTQLGADARVILLPEAPANLLVQWVLDDNTHRLSLAASPDYLLDMKNTAAQLVLNTSGHVEAAAWNWSQALSAYGHITNNKNINHTTWCIDNSLSNGKTGNPIVAWELRDPVSQNQQWKLIPVG